MFNNWISRKEREREKKKDLVCSIYWFLWCKYSHQGWFQDTKITAPKVALGRMCTISSREWVWTGSSTLLGQLMLWGKTRNDESMWKSACPREHAWSLLSPMLRWGLQRGPIRKQQEAVLDWVLTRHGLFGMCLFEGDKPFVAMAGWVSHLGPFSQRGQRLRQWRSVGIGFFIIVLLRGEGKAFLGMLSWQLSTCEVCQIAAINPKSNLVKYNDESC